MTRALKFGWLAAALLSLGGCQNNPFFATPKIFEPAGSEAYQQSRAQRFDPYPEPNIGPRVEGGRPDGYTQPPPEAERGRPNQWTAAPAFGS